MISCPGCGAGMRFDIASQRMKCDFCGMMEDVEKLRGGYQARIEIGGKPGQEFYGQESPKIGSGADNAQKPNDPYPQDGPDSMQITLYSCPQCGGEIYSMDQEAASFCSFCGASVLLEGRMTSTKMPDYVIPFMKSKEDCKNVYKKFTRKAIFTPNKLKDETYLEQFRGIYLPFWTYSFEQKGNVTLTGERESGNYTEKLRLTCDLDASYDGISYDASSAFNDELCSYITPYNRASMKKFHEGYLSGFYADAADVGSDLYRKDAENDANDETIKKIEAQYPKVKVTKPKNASKSLHTKLTDVTGALYPVWFLTYRKDDRVAYAVVNGETGKIAADLPVDHGKFLLGSLILALPIFLILALLPTITAKNQIVIAVILSIATFVIYQLSSREIRNRELRLKDKGYWSKQGRSAAEIKKETKKFRVKGSFRSILPIIGAIAGALIWLANPVSDIYYYGGSIFVLACIVITLIGLIGRFNLLTTRPIPEFFDREGGDNRA